MYRTQPIVSGVRGSAAILVIAAHVVVIYAVAVTLGVVPAPTIERTMTATVIEPEQRPLTPDEPVPGPMVNPPATAVPVPVPTVVVDADEPTGIAVFDRPVPAEPSAFVPEAGSPPILETTRIAVKRRVDPLYPPAARRLDQEGTVRVRILVDERGRALDVQVARSSGYDSLDQAAVSAVRRWQFSPATENSRAIYAWTEVSVIFRLDR